MQNEQYRAKLEKSNERSLALVKAGMDVVVAFGLLQLAPKKVTPRVTGAFGFASSLISCYQVFSGCFKKTICLYMCRNLKINSIKPSISGLCSYCRHIPNPRRSERRERRKDKLVSVAYSLVICVSPPVLMLCVKFVL